MKPPPTFHFSLPPLPFPNYPFFFTTLDLRLKLNFFLLVFTTNPPLASLPPCREEGRKGKAEVKTQKKIFLFLINEDNGSKQSRQQKKIVFVLFFKPRSVLCPLTVLYLLCFSFSPYRLPFILNKKEGREVKGYRIYNQQLNLKKPKCFFNDL